jgi:hypothetical protein
MAQKNEVRHSAKCQITAETTVTLASAVPAQKRKEDATKTLYLNRI